LSAYGYTNADDSMRFVVEKMWYDDEQLDFSGWDVQIWTRDPAGMHRLTTYSERAAELFETRREAKAYVRDEYLRGGSLKPLRLGPDDVWLSRWERSPAFPWWRY